MKLSIYRFTDGYKAYFLAGDKLCHIVVKPGEAFSFDGINPTTIEMRDMNMSYPQWKGPVMAKRRRDERTRAHKT